MACHFNKLVIVLWTAAGLTACQAMSTGPSNASGSASGASSTVVAGGAEAGAAANNDSHGGTIGPSIGTADIQPCADGNPDCAKDGEDGAKLAATMAAKTVGGVCTQDYFRAVCWGSDFRQDAGLDQKTEAEQFTAISQGQIPDKIMAQASFRDVCVAQVDPADPQALGSHTKSFQNFCLFVKPQADSHLLADIDELVPDDFRADLANTEFIAFLDKSRALPLVIGNGLHLIGGINQPAHPPAEIKRPGKE